VKKKNLIKWFIGFPVSHTSPLLLATHPKNREEKKEKNGQTEKEISKEEKKEKNGQTENQKRKRRTNRK
jgi:hypothetical protein